MLVALPVLCRRVAGVAELEALASTLVVDEDRAAVAADQLALGVEESLDVGLVHGLGGADRAEPSQNGQAEARRRLVTGEGEAAGTTGEAAGAGA